VTTTERTKEIAEKLKGYSEDELIAFRQNRDSEIDLVLADRDLARRDAEREREAQHELDRKLIAEQVKWMKFSAVIGVLGTILGALLGAWLQSTRTLDQRQAARAAVQRQAEGTASVSPKEKTDSVQPGSSRR
jgi:hypothetical protein